MAEPISMSATVEAKSLATLTSLASDPPQHPRNPNHIRQEPLVLYIARVPGSKDVFLSPMKPREKVVTAEDVQSSLYYLHVDQPDHLDLLDSNNTFQENFEDEPPENHISMEVPRRKPALPSRPPSYATVAPNQSAYQNASNSDYAPSHGLERKSIPPLHSRNDIENRHNVAASSFARKPVPPVRHGHQQGPISNFESNQGENLQSRDFQKSRIQPLYPDDFPPPPPPHASLNSTPKLHEPEFNENRPTQHVYPVPPYQERRPSPERRSPARKAPGNVRRAPNTIQNGVSLTLIRRDPASSAQWNVASVLDPPTYDISSSQLSVSSQSTKQAGAPMYIEVTNPGYDKFLLANPTKKENSYHTGPQGHSVNNPLDRMTSQDSSVQVFQRRLWMEGSRFNDSNFGHRKSSSNDSYSQLTVNAPNSGGQRGDSLDYPDGPLRRDSQGFLPFDEGSKKKSTFKGYAFMSPWNTRCEFSTGGGGGSLRCSHIVPVGHSSASGASSYTLSELRFNLPSSFSRPTSRHPSEDGTSKRSSIFSKSRHTLAELARASLHEDSKLDLTLGQETAGGGFGGKQAKLGKLIIEDEGMKMMDLLVAANMALWWRAYERADKT